MATALYHINDIHPEAAQRGSHHLGYLLQDVVRIPADETHCTPSTLIVFFYHKYVL